MTATELRDLIERAYQIKEMQKTDGWLYLVDETNQRLDAIRREVLAGRLDLDEYQRCCGFLEGAAYVLDAGKYVSQRVEQEQERQNQRDAA